MEADLWSLLGILAEHSGALLWAILKGLLIWGTIALAIIPLLYFATVRWGVVDIRGQRKRAARVVYVLVLLLAVWPLATGAGVVHELGGATLRSVRKEVNKTEVLPTTGAVLVAPMVLAHLVAEQRFDSVTAAALSWEQITSNDLSFLTIPDQRDRCFEVMTESLLRSAMERVPGHDEAENNRSARWLMRRAESQAAEKVGRKVSVYTRLFREVEPDGPGKLTYASASDQVGAAFWREVAEPAIRAPFDQLRLMMLVGAVLVWLLAIAVIQLVGRWRANAGAATGPPPGTGAQPPGGAG